jgi:hypothetical protein
MPASMGLSAEKARNTRASAGAQLTPGHPGHELVADPAHHVVPPVGQHLDRQVDQVRLLRGQEPAHQFRRDVHLSSWHALWAHAATLARPLHTAPGADFRPAQLRA